jgi:hypothetical protein
MEQNINPIKKWWYDITHIRKNYKKVQASPYASLAFALKARKLIIGLIIPYLIFMCYRMVVRYHASGIMQTFGRAVTIAIFAYLIYRMWKTIPDAKKQIAYYKKYPHTINYCPTNVKEDVDDIIKKIKENKAKKEDEEKNVSKKKEARSGNSKTNKIAGA